MSVRRARSLTPSTVSDSIKRGIKSHTDSKCWLCKNDGEEVAHMLDNADIILLNLHIENGLVDEKTHLNCPDNLIFLCYVCHKGFDRRTPKWVFLPYPLDQFLAAERTFQAARLTDTSAAREAVSRTSLQYRPYLIREGNQQHIWDGVTNRSWHGDPVIAILRSYAIAAGLQRLPVEKGGVPQEVADMYLELVGLYGTAAPVQTQDTITVEGTLGADTIRVARSVGLMGPPLLKGKRGSKRPAETDDQSDAGSVATSNQTWQSGETALSEKPLASRRPGLRSAKRAANWDSESEIGSVAVSDKTGRSNDTQFTRAVGLERPAKRARLEDDTPVSDVSGWVAERLRSKR